MFNFHRDHHHHTHIDLVITARQMELFSHQMTEVFVAKTIVFLRKNFAAWTANKDDAALGEYIRKMMALGKKHAVTKQINLQKLMHYHIVYGFEIPLSKELEHVLNDHQHNENMRVTNFYQSVRAAALAEAGGNKA